MSTQENFPPEYTRWWVEFYYQKFSVSPAVLIPRLETESLVREAIKFCRADMPDILIDVGTGSGIIPLSILSVVDIPNVYAVDISTGALEVARKNNENQGKNIHFLESNLLWAFLEKEMVLPESSNILLVTNLPYIKAEDWENMSTDTRYEPKEALFGGEHTGFELYEKLFDQVQLFLGKYNPEKLTILAEMGEDQNDIARKVLEYHGWKLSFFADLLGVERFMRVEIL